MNNRLKKLRTREWAGLSDDEPLSLPPDNAPPLDPNRTYDVQLVYRPSKKAAMDRSQEPEPAPKASPPGRASSGKGEKASDRHARKCAICHHPDRDAIEQDFLLWRRPNYICEDHGLADRSTIYRHAHATGLYSRRARNLRVVLDRILERADDVRVTAGSIVQAARAYARINESGEWIEPPSRHVVLVSGAAQTRAASPPAGPPEQPPRELEHPASSPERPDSNRHTSELEHESSR